MKWFRSKNYPKHLFILFFLTWVMTWINPNDFYDLILENAATVVFLIILVSTYSSFRLSNVSYTLIFIYLIIHIIGAHYTYSLVPYNEWFKSVFGTGINEILGFERNHYDRLVHFAFGLFLAYPIREFFLRVANVKGFWGYYLPLDVVMAFSMVYELIEWAAATIFGGGLGQTFLGAQGDIWDAHKDMLLATTGAIISMSIIGIINYKYKKNFGKDIQKSLAVKRKTPLGEVELRRMKKKKH